MIDEWAGRVSGATEEAWVKTTPRPASASAFGVVGRE
jgi:hypothetical protein